MVAQRKEGNECGLHWEFPGGTLEEDARPRVYTRRELREELGRGVEIGNIRQAVFEQYKHFNILLLAYQYRIKSGMHTAIGCREVRWAAKTELRKLQMPPADEAVRERLLK